MITPTRFCLLIPLLLVALTRPTPAQTTLAPTTAHPHGQRMTIDGEIFTYQVPSTSAIDGSPVPVDCRAEVCGQVFVAKADLPPGDYTVEVKASENSYAEAGRRIFTIQMASGRREMIAKDLDLFALAGSAGKPVTLKALIHHPGGAFNIAFTASLDNAKFSAIRILNPRGDKVAWAFAEDLDQLLRIPGTPPVIPGPILWKDPAQPLDKRVADLIRRLTLREKTLQLRHSAPAIDRLGLPSYNYWSECLHGVARNGPATVFPQSIGMAASFDPTLLQHVGDIISTEARAKFATAQANRTDADPYGTSGVYAGLTFWSPNINLFRDPRWGRGQETYGEDPFLTGTMAVAFIKGLQGSDPHYLKVIATAKHFAVHSGPESLRHVFDADPPERDFYDYYLPHFEMAVRDAHVYSVMGAYNRVYGQPACASDLLLKTILRRDWGFQGYVVSDCGAISDIWFTHQTAANQAEAAADALLAGCDLECGSDFASLAVAVDLNLVGEGALDTALSRVLMSRFKLGLFDPSDKVPYARITAAQNDTPANAAAALQMARESLILLKNDGTLPLRKNLKLAVVGPNADSLLPLLGNYNGTPTAPITVLDGLRRTLPSANITYIRGCESAALTSQWQMIPDIFLRATVPAASSAPETGFHAEYFDNPDLAGAPQTIRNDKVIDFYRQIEWQIPNVPIKPMSARWTADFIAPEDGDYRFLLSGRPGFRFFAAGQTIVDNWKGDTLDQGLFTISLKTGQSLPLRIECWQIDGLMALHLYWQHFSAAATAAAATAGTQPAQSDLDVPKLVANRVKDADAILFVGGLDGHMEAEEGDVRADFEGFDNGDRESIELPPAQSRLLHALAATGKPTIFINMTGSAIAMPWEADHLNAILQAWYPGQSGGRAIAEALFGDYNPAGRLPITFYRASDDLPPFTDYAMNAGRGRTYRYFTGQPLYPFGYGLSYTHFQYSNLTLSASATSAPGSARGSPAPVPTVAPTDTLTVSLDLTNTGQRDGDEVVQLYIRPATPAPDDPVRRLVSFRRIPIPAGRTVHLTLPLPIASLRNWDTTRKAYLVPPGRYTVEAAASSTDIRLTRDLLVR